MVAAFRPKINKCKNNFAFCLKMCYISSMEKKAKIKNEINLNVRIDSGLMNRINKCRAKKWNINISIFAREALKHFCEVVEKEKE